MLERELQDGIAQVARILGYRVFHARPAQSQKGWRTPVAYDGKGYVDLTIVGHGRILFVECKVGRNTLSPEQAAWLEALRGAGQEAVVWTEADWNEGIVEAVLRREQQHERSAA